MRVRFTRRVIAEDAALDIDPVFDSNGRFTPESLARIKAAAAKGDAVSMANLGVGLQVAGDRTGALHWLGKAWDAGNVVAGFNLGTLYTEAGDTNRAQTLWERCAALGDADAMLGLIRQAVERNDPRSAGRWIHAVYTQEEAFPITAMGVAFAGGGYIEPAMWAYRRAVELGDGFAMEYLAAILEKQGSFEEAKALRLRSETAERML